jgi:redox-sensitive bicupin YhaK (pirin superfamily)
MKDIWKKSPYNIKHDKKDLIYHNKSDILTFYHASLCAAWRVPMLSKIPSERIFNGDYGWHSGRFHFSFGDYDDPGNSNFGELIAFNDFEVQPGSGFETHPHREIEIITYCVEGELTHMDSMGNLNKSAPGDMQYTCAGSGILHSEINTSTDMPLRFVQIWLKPNAESLPPRYISKHYRQDDRLNKVLQIASGQELTGVIRVNQDTNIYVSEIEPGKYFSFELSPGFRCYLACLEGSLRINDLRLDDGDAVKIWDETALEVSALEQSQIILVEISALD